MKAKFHFAILFLTLGVATGPGRCQNFSRGPEIDRTMLLPKPCSSQYNLYFGPGGPDIRALSSYRKEDKVPTRYGVYPRCGFGYANRKKIAGWFDAFRTSLQNSSTPEQRALGGKEVSCRFRCTSQPIRCKIPRMFF